MLGTSKLAKKLAAKLEEYAVQFETKGLEEAPHNKEFAIGCTAAAMCCRAVAGAVLEVAD
jgi:hypothetical protein